MPFKNRLDHNRNGRKYGKTFKGKLCRMWLSANQRVIGQDKDRAHKYKGLAICTIKEFYKKFETNSAYISRYIAWKNAKFPLKLSPSIDRINNSRGYTLDNIQILTQSENRRKERCYHSLHPKRCARKA